MQPVEAPMITKRLVAAERIAVIAGGRELDQRAAAEVEHLLQRALVGYDGVIVTTGGAPLTSLVTSLGRRMRIATVAYENGGRGHGLDGTVRVVDDGDPLAQAIAIWTDVLAAGRNPDDVQTVVFPSDPDDVSEVVLARALGVRVAWLGIPVALSDTRPDSLPLGAGTGVELAAGPRTLRAFLISSRIPAEIRERFARLLHDRDRRLLRTTHADESALPAWEQESSARMHARLTEADDIPISSRSSDCSSPGADSRSC